MTLRPPLAKTRFRGQKRLSSHNKGTKAYKISAVPPSFLPFGKHSKPDNDSKPSAPTAHFQRRRSWANFKKRFCGPLSAGDKPSLAQNAEFLLSQSQRLSFQLTIAHLKQKSKKKVFGPVLDRRRRVSFSRFCENELKKAGVHVIIGSINGDLSQSILPIYLYGFIQVYPLYCL